MNYLSGNTGNQWNQKTVDLTAYIGQIINIRFRGITGSYYRSDMALDDINIKEKTGTGINEGSLISNILIYPNPGDGKFNLSFNDVKQDHWDITVCDPQGRMLYNKIISDITSGYQTVLDISGFVPGIYFVILKNENFTHTRRIIIQ